MTKLKTTKLKTTKPKTMMFRRGEARGSSRGTGVEPTVLALMLLASPLVLAHAEATAGAAPGFDREPAQSAAAAGGAKLSKTDLEVLQKLHAANQTEIQMGKMAREKGASKEVKSFGDRLVSDHTAVDKKLADVLKKHGATLADLGTTTSNDSSHDVTVDKTGVEFDRAFAAQMADDHKKAIELVETGRRNTSDGGLRSFLDQLLPTLRAHEATARALMEGKGHA